MTDVIEVTGELVGRRRQELGLSRENFARRIGLTPGAVWRIEVKHRFKPGEVEHLRAVADTWLVGGPAAPQTPLRRPKVQAPTAASPAADDLDGEDLELVQWLDPATSGGPAAIDLTRVAGTPSLIDRVLPRGQRSPTDLTKQDGLWRVSNSELATFRRCRRKWWGVYHRGLRPRHEVAFGARATGTRGHLALQAWYRTDDRIDPRDAFEAIIAEERRQLTQRDADDLSAEELVRFNKDAELERVVLEGYVQWLADTGADAEYEVIGSEQYLEARLPEFDNVVLVARLDARLRRTSDGVRLFMDHKFVGSIPQAVRLLPMNEQMLFYILIENLQEVDEPPVAGALYNMLRRVKRTASANPPFYERVEVHHNVHDLNSFKKRVGGVIDDIEFVRTELEKGEDHRLVAYPTPTRDCAWDCPLLKICPMFDDGSRVEDAIDAHFVVGDPYGYYKSSIEKNNENEGVM